MDEELIPPGGWTIANLNALTAAIATGARIVRYGDKEITYHNLDQMLRLRDLMRLELGITKPARSKGLGFSKGLN